MTFTIPGLEAEEAVFEFIDLFHSVSNLFQALDSTFLLFPQLIWIVGHLVEGRNTYVGTDIEI